MTEKEIQEFKININKVLNIFFNIDFEKNKNLANWIFENFYPSKVKFPFLEVFQFLNNENIGFLDFNVSKGILTIEIADLYIAVFKKSFSGEVQCLDEIMEQMPKSVKKTMFL